MNPRIPAGVEAREDDPMHVESFFDPDTCTLTHVVVDPAAKACAVIDSVLDFDQDAARITTACADRVIDYVERNGLTNQWLLETHIHADHITAAFYLKKRIGGRIGIGTGIRQVLDAWVPIFDALEDTPLTGEQFDAMFEDGETFRIGGLEGRVMHTPGHTPACATYLIEGAAFVGDTLFNPDLGTARCDFPGGSARRLYQSIRKIYALPDETVLYLCHDYPKDDAAPLIRVTVGEQKARNVMLDGAMTEDAFVAKREARDATLAVPRLLLPSIQTNLRVGDFGPVDAHGRQYLKIPINVV